MREQLEDRRMLVGDLEVSFEYSVGGNSVTSLTQGDEVMMDVFVRDIRDNPSGIFEAHFDLAYASSLISIAPDVVDDFDISDGVDDVIKFGPDFDEWPGKSGDTTTPGLINEVGSFDEDSVGPTGVDRFAKVLLFSVPFNVIGSGTLTFTGGEADVFPHGISFFDPPFQVSFSDVDFVGNEIEISEVSTPVLSIASTTAGNESGPINGLFTVNQALATTTNTVVSYSVGGTATPGSDFTPLSGSVTILANQTSATITVPVINDDIVDPAETVTVTLTGFTGRTGCLDQPDQQRGHADNRRQRHGRRDRFGDLG